MPCCVCLSADCFRVCCCMFVFLLCTPFRFNDNFFHFKKKKKVHGSIYLEIAYVFSFCTQQDHLLTQLFIKESLLKVHKPVLYHVILWEAEALTPFVLQAFKF